MWTISRVRRRTNLSAVLTWLAFALAPAHAYDFTLGDLRTEMQIVQNFAAGTLDHAALSEKARQGIEHPWGPPNSVHILKGRLLEVCPTLSVTNEYGHQYQFRSKYEGGYADWIITIPPNKESQIDGIFIAVVPIGANPIGAPLALPPMLPGAEMHPPGSLCLSPQKVILLEQREQEACAEWPDLCQVR